jgi:integrase
MASIHRKIDSRYWFAAWRDLRGRLHVRSTKIEANPPHENPRERSALAGRNKRLATEFAARLETEARGNPVALQLRRIVEDIGHKLDGVQVTHETTRAYLGAFLDRTKATAKPATFTRYAATCAAFLRHLGQRADKHLQDVTPRDIDSFFSARLSEGVSPQTVAVDRKTLNRPFALAAKQGLVIQNPVTAADSIDATTERREPFTASEIQRLLNHATADWKTAILLGALAGLRLSDAANLQWASIDWAGRCIRFRPEKTSRKRRDLIVPLHATLEAHLLTLPAADDATAPVCPTLCGRRTGARAGLSAEFADIMLAAGIDAERGTATGRGRAMARKSFHSTRHFFVTALESAGVAADLRMMLSGHTSLATSRRYTHTAETTLAGAIDKLPALEIRP